MSATALAAVRLSFAHGDAVPLFDSISFRLSPGFTGLVGENGSGKTTLLELLAGLRAPDAGHVRLEPDAAKVVLCRQIAEEATCSPGERKWRQIGAALAEDPDVLLLDEPTNHLDGVGRARLIAALRRFRGIGVVVSHDRALLDELTTRTLRLDGRGGLSETAGGYRTAKQRWDRDQVAARETRAAARDRVRAAQRNVAEARREHEAASRMKATSARSRGKYDSDARTLGAKNLVEWAEKGIGKRIGTQRTELARAQADLAALGPAEKEPGRSLQLGWVPPTRRILLAHEGLFIGPGDRLHVAGANGAGKTTLLRALLAGSTLPPDRVFYLPQELEEDPLPALRALPREERGRTFSLCAALGVDPDRLLATASPSPGEARKVAIAAALAQKVWLLVLDEPTNHLDLPAIERLEAALAAYPGALVLVTHDDPLAARLCTRRVALQPNIQVIA